MKNMIKRKFNALVKKHINHKLNEGLLTYPSAQQLLELYEMKLETLEATLYKK